MNKIKIFLSQTLESPAAVPLALLVVCLGGYGVLIPWVGYYGDDLSYAWLAYQSHQIRLFFEGNRPFFGDYFSLLTQFLGPAPWHWQVLELLCRWGSALALWYLLRLVWPRQKAAAVTAAALFALYPGFWLNSEALTFHPFFVQLIIFLCSLVATVLSLRSPTRRLAWLAAALLGAFMNIWISEYFYTLELVRLVLIWFELGRQPGSQKQRLGRAFLQDLPFLALFGGYMGLRLCGVGNYSGTYSLVLLDNLRVDAWGAVQGLVVRIVQDVWTFSIYSFGRTFSLPGLENRSLKVIVPFLAVMLLVTLLWFAWMRRIEKPTRTFSLIGAGVLCLLLAGGPIWAADLRWLGDAGTSRFSMPFMLGACLLVVGLVGLIPWAGLRAAGYAALTSACMAYQLLLGFNFVQQVEAQKDFLWQLAERMPQLRSGTLLITNLDLLDYNSDNSNAALVNWLYNPLGGQRIIDYYVTQDLRRMAELIDQGQRFVAPEGGQRFVAPEGGQTATPTLERHSIGLFNFQSVVVISYHYPNCLRILDPELDIANPYFPLVYREAARLTDYAAAGVAVADGQIPRPPVELYGRQALPDNWCRDYQKASRAAQMAEWNRVVEVGNHALAREYPGTNPPELLVFIEGYARTGNWQRAGELIRSVVEQDKLYTPMLCRLKDRLTDSTPDTPDRTQALQRLACPAAP